MPSIIGALMGRRENQVALAMEYLHEAVRAHALPQAVEAVDRAEFWARQANRHGTSDDADRLAGVLMVRIGIEGAVTGLPAQCERLGQCVSLLDASADAGSVKALGMLHEIAETVGSECWEGALAAARN